MNVTPLALHSPRAVRDALRLHGWDPHLAESTAAALQPSAFKLTGLSTPTLEALVRAAGQLGLDVVTGSDWAVLAGGRARLSAFARPWTAPEPLVELAVQVGLALPAEPPMVWRTARGDVPLARPIVMGVLNVTPDSFSDGGRFSTVDEALRQAGELLAAGADMLDVGGESTRPGRDAGVAEDEERRRAVPVVAALAREFPDVTISVDTVKSAVAAAALDEGAAVVNDISAGRLDPALLAVAARARAGMLLMHSRGSITEVASYAHAEYGGDVSGVVLAELKGAVNAATAAGIAAEAIAIDPGFGFGKTLEQNFLLLDRLAELEVLGRPIAVGPSRKRFLGAATGRPPDDRDRATAVVCAMAFGKGARIFRVHDVGLTREALALATAVHEGYSEA